MTSLVIVVTWLALCVATLQPDRRIRWTLVLGCLVFLLLSWATGIRR